MAFEITGKTYSRLDLIKKYSIPLLVIIGLWICYWFQFLKIDKTKLVIVISIITFDSLKDFFRKRLVAITFNSQEKTLSIRLKSFIGKVETSIIKYDVLRIELDRPKWKRVFPTKVFFLKNKMEVYELNLRNNHINERDIEKAIEICRSADIPVTYL
jgi:hypothetical protein